MTGKQIKGKLSVRQIEIAIYFVAGHSDKSIARITHRVQDTVKHHINDIVQEFCCATRAEAVIPVLVYLLEYGINPRQIFSNSPVLEPKQREALIKALDEGQHHFQS